MDDILYFKIIFIYINHLDMKIYSSLILLAVSMYSLISCKKEDDFEPEKYADETLIFPNEMPNADGIFLAARDMIGIDLTGTQEVAVDMALVQIGSNPFVEVGTVKLNNKALAKSTANQYSSDLETLNFDLVPGKQNRWNISGNNGHAAFDKTISIKMPQKIEVANEPSVISRNQAITFQLKNYPNNAQAIIWNLKDVDNKYIQKETNTPEVTFTADELQTLVPGKNSLLKVAAYSMETWTNGDKKYNFLNETVETVYLAIQ